MNLKRKSCPPPHLCATMALAACAVYLFTSDAQSSDYALIDLGKVNANDTDLIAHGINGHGEIVGELKLSGESGTKAFIWLPKANYGQSAGMYLLDDLVSLGGPLALGTIAYDINDAGLAVGRDREGQLTADPIVWNLADMSDLRLNAENSIAFSINNDSPAQMVGGIIPDFEGDNATTNPQSGAAFIYAYDPMNTTVSYLPFPGTPPRNGGAFGLSETVNAELRIAGNMSCNPDPQDPEKCNGNPSCLEDFRDGVWWSSPTAAAELAAPGIVAGFATFASGHAVSNDKYIAGFGRDPNAGPPDCRWRAYFWQNPTMTPDELPVFNDAAVDNELALDIRNQVGDTVEIVGRNLNETRALLWRGIEVQGSFDWGTAALDLNDTDLIGSLGSFSRLVSANAINDSGWIAGFGTKGSEIHAFALIPCDAYESQGLCPPDLTGQDSSCGDGVINVFDLLLLLANWDTDGPGANLAEPFDNLDVFDLIALLGAWGPCSFSEHVEVLSLEEELADAGLTTDDWADFEEAMMNGTAAEKEQHKCWMERYLTGCAVCPPCKGPDPYQ